MTDKRVRSRVKRKNGELDRGRRDQEQRRHNEGKRQVRKYTSS